MTGRTIAQIAERRVRLGSSALGNRPGQWRGDQYTGNESSGRAGCPAVPPGRSPALRRIYPERAACCRRSCVRRSMRTRSSTISSRRPRSPSAPVAREDLESAIESEEGGLHVHGPDCGHDHGHDHKPKKAAAKKADAEAALRQEACCRRRRPRLMKRRRLPMPSPPEASRQESACQGLTWAQHELRRRPVLIRPGAFFMSASSVHRKGLQGP